MANLSTKKCIPCKKGTPPLEGEVVTELSNMLGKEWKVVNEHHIEKEFRFKDFAEALVFINKVGALAEEEQHHPDVHLSWGKARIVLWTHKINGLSENDFILAAKIDQIYT
ncbi:MAG: 4a-hydroxytetrahydrobiopterin dehydratase [Chlamydiales bacterium]